MGEKTDKLGHELEKLRPEKIGEYLQQNKTDMLDGEREFTSFMRERIKLKGYKWKDVYRAAGISEEYGQELIGMRKHTLNRDLIIKLCLAMHLNPEETQHALTLYGMQPLYPRNSRDAIILIAINNRVYELADVDDLLLGQGMEILSEMID